MDFGAALNACKKGSRISRKGWNGKGLWIEIQRPDLNSRITRSYLLIVCPKGSTNHFKETQGSFEVERIPWLPSQTDILSDDWEVLAEMSSSRTGKTKMYAFKNSRGQTVYSEAEHSGNQYLKRFKSGDKWAE